MIGGKHYDAVILGAGLGGLLTAALLAKRGRHVLVLEEGEAPGGLSRRVVRNGYRFDIGPLLFLGFERNGLYDRIFMELGLSLTSVKREAKLIRKLSPALQLVLSSHRLDLSLDPVEFMEELSREFSADRPQLQRLSGRIDEAFAEINALVLSESSPVRDWKSLPLRWMEDAKEWIKLRRLRGPSLEQFLDSLAIEPALRAGFERIMTLFSGKPPAQCSEFDMLLLLGFMRQEVVEIDGGVPNLGEQLVELINKFQGDVLFSQRVSEIVVNRGKVTELRLPKQTHRVAGCVVAHVPAARFRPTFDSVTPVVFYFGIPADTVPGPMLHHLILDPDPARTSGPDHWMYVTLTNPQDGDAAPEGYRGIRVVVMPDAGSVTKPRPDDLRSSVEKRLTDLMPFSDESISYLGEIGDGPGAAGRLSAVDERLIARARKRGWPERSCYTHRLRNFYLLPDGGNDPVSHLWEARAARDLANRISPR